VQILVSIWALIASCQLTISSLGQVSLLRTNVVFVSWNASLKSGSYD